MITNQHHQNLEGKDKETEFVPHVAPITRSSQGPPEVGHWGCKNHRNTDGLAGSSENLRNFFLLFASQNCFSGRWGICSCALDVLAGINLFLHYL
jgi:hypothetical protein